MGKSMERNSDVSLLMKLWSCAWLAVVWMPIFWPLWISMWMLSPLLGSSKTVEGKGEGEQKPSRKLSTKGSLGLFIIMAAVVIRVSCLPSLHFSTPNLRTAPILFVFYKF